MSVDTDPTSVRVTVDSAMLLSLRDTSRVEVLLLSSCHGPHGEGIHQAWLADLPVEATPAPPCRPCPTLQTLADMHAKAAGVTLTRTVWQQQLKREQHRRTPARVWASALTSYPARTCWQCNSTQVSGSTSPQQSRCHRRGGLLMSQRTAGQLPHLQQPPTLSRTLQLQLQHPPLQQPLPVHSTPAAPPMQ
jgi:hypothetical protein